MILSHCAAIISSRTFLRNTDGGCKRAVRGVENAWGRLVDRVADG